MTKLRVRSGVTDENDREADRTRFERAELRARLAAERAELLSSLLGLDTPTLERRPIVGNTTATDMLERIAGQEELFTTRIRQALELPALGVAVEETSDEAEITSTRSRFEHAVMRCVAARKTFLDTVALVPDEQLTSEETREERGTSLMALVIQSYWNDASYSLRLNTWSKDEGLGMAIGPALVLLAAVRAARKELLTSIALVPAAFRAKALTRTVTTIIGLESQFLDALPGSREPSVLTAAEASVDTGPDDDGETWERVWSSLHTTHAHVLRKLEALHEDGFSMTIVGPSGARDTVYMWTRGCLLHDRIQASAIRATLGLDWPQRLLR